VGQRAASRAAPDQHRLLHWSFLHCQRHCETPKDAIAPPRHPASSIRHLARKLHSEVPLRRRRTYDAGITGSRLFRGAAAVITTASYGTIVDYEGCDDGRNSRKAVNPHWSPAFLPFGDLCAIKIQITNKCPKEMSFIQGTRNRFRSRTSIIYYISPIVKST
jgi:hypothetical protein